MKAKKEISVSIELAELFVDFLKIIELFKAFADVCAGKKGSYTSECCSGHTLLKKKYEALQERAKKISPGTIRRKGEPLSPYWWRKQGIEYYA